MVVWSEEAVLAFINIYKKHTCLWKVKSSDYKNRRMRDEAYKELVAYCKQIGFRNANREFCVKKVQSLRGSFRKELRKTMASLETAKSEAHAYRPSLFYFDMLMFTKDQEMMDDDNNDDNDEANDVTYNPEDDDSNDDDWKDEVNNIATIEVCPFSDTSTSNAISIDGRFCQKDEVSSHIIVFYSLKCTLINQHQRALLDMGIHPYIATIWLFSSTR